MTREQFIKRWPNFSPEELACKCGKCTADSAMNMNQEFMDKLQTLRTSMGFAFVISSGFRCSEHPVEKSKSQPGTHAMGMAVDIVISGEKALKVISGATDNGFTGVGISQKGNGRFVHLDTAEQAANRPRPWVWSY